LPSAANGVAARNETAPAKLEKPPVTGAEGKALGDLHGRSNGPLQRAASASAQPESSVGASELSQQVADYRIAVAELRSNPALALERLKAHRARWPSSAIRHEVDLRIIEALVTLGRHNEASDAARFFLQRYPDSSRAMEVRRIAESDTTTGQVDN
jgi:TolA-binding protein